MRGVTGIDTKYGIWSQPLIPPTYSEVEALQAQASFWRPSISPASCYFSTHPETKIGV